jgi:uncharacterized membrane protein YsdA (DUF1294 family)
MVGPVFETLLMWAEILLLYIYIIINIFFFFFFWRDQRAANVLEY